jgi:serine/threonine protein kinase
MNWKKLPNFEPILQKLKEKLQDEYEIDPIPLGEGGSSIVYKARNKIQDKIYALKLDLHNRSDFPNIDEKLEKARQEFDNLNKKLTPHSNIIRAIWFDKIIVTLPQENAEAEVDQTYFCTLFEFRENSVSLDKWLKNPENEKKRSSWKYIQKWVREIGGALAHIHQCGLIYKDLKPENILYDPAQDQFLLIDFNISSSSPDKEKGTLKYVAPFVIKLQPNGKPLYQWSPAADTFAFGAALYECITGGQYPWNRRPTPYSAPNEKAIPISQKHPELAEPVAQFIDKALSITPAEGFPDANAMLSAFEEVKNYKINPRVNDLLGVYQYSATANVDNRGLETDFAKATYIPTRLDTQLADEILKRKFSIVFLIGNPGDGKTAFLKQILEKLKAQNGEIQEENPAGWLALYQGHKFTACYDASESFENQTADQRLTRLFEPFQGQAINAPRQTLLIAINDGKLISFFFNPKIRERFPALSNIVIDAYFEKDHDTIKVINLKLRAFIDYDFKSKPGDSIFDKQLHKFLEPQAWEPTCGECDAQSFCPIYHNVMALRKRQVRNQLKKLLAIGYIRGIKRNTLRDMRSTLAFAITANLTCRKIHSNPKLELESLYFNSLFESLQGSMEEEIKILDPAKKPIPELDHFLAFELQANPSQGLPKLLSFLNSSIYPQPQDIFQKSRFEKLSASQKHTYARRRLYFEAVSQKLRKDFNYFHNPDRLLPYTYFKEFIAILESGKNNFASPPNAPKKIKKIKSAINNLLKGISQSEELNPDALAKPKIENNPNAKRFDLLLRIAQNLEQGLWVTRGFRKEDFAIEANNLEPTRLRYLEAQPASFWLVFRKDENIKLEINLNLYELLMKMAKQGVLPFSEEFATALDDLLSFKSKLHKQAQNNVTLIENEFKATTIFIQKEGFFCIED